MKARFGPTSCYLTVAARLGRFTCLAISCLDNGDFHRFTAEAIVDTTARLVKRQSLERVAKTDPAMVRSLLTMTTANLQRLENHILLLGCNTARERVAAFLLEMNGRLTAAGVIALPMSRRDIPDYLGLAFETVSRVFSAFQRKGYLRFLDPMQRQIVVLNAAGLTELDAPRKHRWLRRKKDTPSVD